MQTFGTQSRLQMRVAETFDSPATTSVDELVALREAALALKRGSRQKPRTEIAGGFTSKALGRGLDFAEVRLYQPGDDVRMIDWKVTARTSQAHTKLFVEERERPFFLVVDCRSSMRFATRKMFKSVMAARLAAIAGWCAVGAGDRVGGVVFGDHHHVEIKPQSGRRGLLLLFRAIEQAHRDADDNAATEAGLLPQINRLRHLVHAGSSVCLFSDFTGFDAACESALGSLARTTDLLGVWLEDPFDHNLPPAGRYTLADAVGRLSIDTSAEKVRRFYQHRHQQRNLSLQRIFSANRSRLLTLSTDLDFIDAANQLLHRSVASR
ncbi:MAG: DUF58 domain-containing protein [Gammaproteobacteria bacterium]|nr:DUF58 domain-containing protein [Gammaproteobacteria bacterium]